jgi:hypothetical protein
MGVLASLHQYINFGLQHLKKKKHHSEQTTIEKVGTLTFAFDFSLEITFTATSLPFRLLCPRYTVA